LDQKREVWARSPVHEQRRHLPLMNIKEKHEVQLNPPPPPDCAQKALPPSGPKKGRKKPSPVVKRGGDLVSRGPR